MALMNAKLLVALPVFPLVLLSCGGASGGSGANSGQDSAFGPFLTRAQGSPQVVTSSNGGPTITGVVGAAFSKITYMPTNSLANTRIAYVDGPIVSFTTLNIANSDGSGDHVVPGVMGVYNRPAWSRDGRIMYSHQDNKTSAQTIWVTNSDGSNNHQLTNGTVDVDPAWSLDNFHVAFSRFDSVSGKQQIFTMTASGGSVTRISDGSANDNAPTWSPDGSTIFFVRLNPTSFNHEWWKMSSTGASPTLIEGANNYYRVNMSPAGNAIALNTIQTSGVDVDLGSWPFALPIAAVISDGNSNLLGSWAPDGSRILVSRTVNGTTSLNSVVPDGSRNSVVLSHSDGYIRDCSWEPFPVAIPYIAATGGSIFGTSAAGFLYGLNGDGFASFLTFTATTPATATATVDPVTPGASNLIYKIGADAITSIKFVNGLGGGTNSLSIGTGIKGAVIAFNGGTGGISSVVPYASSKAALVAKRGTEVVLTGRFAGAYDGHGKNLAPAGASQVVLSNKGELLYAK